MNQIFTGITKKCCAAEGCIEYDNPAQVSYLTRLDLVPRFVPYKPLKEPSLPNTEHKNHYGA